MQSVKRGSAWRTRSQTSGKVKSENWGRIVSGLLSEDSCSFYKHWRENYRWPPKSNRKSSELELAGLLNEARDALLDFSRLGRPVLRKIHHWKTRNQGGTTEKYNVALNAEGIKEKLVGLQKMLSPPQRPVTAEFVCELLDTLRISYANLPVCSAQASFLTERTIPILDRFVAQFFSPTVSPRILRYTISDNSRFNMRRVFMDFQPMNFIIEDDGTNKCKPRLAVYEEKNYNHNRDVFAFTLIPDLDRIAGELREKRVTYQDAIHAEQKEFTAVDVEMAVFTFGMANEHYFRCWYESKPETLSLS
jgi:hypothetical protein